MSRWLAGRHKPEPIRRLMVIVAAWAMRHDASGEEISAALARSFKRKHWLWRYYVIEDAKDRNRRRKDKALARG